jgi:hypothetical protein
MEVASFLLVMICQSRCCLFVLCSLHGTRLMDAVFGGSLIRGGEPTIRNGLILIFFQVIQFF